MTIFGTVVVVDIWPILLLYPINDPSCNRNWGSVARILLILIQTL